MAVAPLPGIKETTTTTGTGTYTLAGAVTGFLALGTSQNGQELHYTVSMGDQWEHGRGTYTHSGRTFTRTEVFQTNAGSTSPISWGAGTKNFIVPISPSRVVMADVINTWRATQQLNGQTVWLDQDNDTGFVFSSDDVILFYALGAEMLKFDGINKQIILTKDDSGSVQGPNIQLFRTSSSPAVNDDIGFIQFSGRDSANAIVTYGNLQARIDDPTAGTIDGVLRFQAALNGSMINAVAVRGVGLTIESGCDLYTGGKTGQSLTTTGAELRADGAAYLVTQDGTAITINRKGSDGTLVDFRRDNSSIGSISVSSGVVSYNAFLGSHYAEWHSAVADAAQYEIEGTVVRFAPGSLGGVERLSLVAPTTAAGDRRVYGVVGSRQPMMLGDRPSSVLMIHAVGTSLVRCVGPVNAGDLLMSSDVPGVACAQPDDEVRACTLGKAMEDSPDAAPRLVPAVLMAG